MSRRFLSIVFPCLATDWFELRRPELKTKAFVLTATDHGRKLITAANPLARKNGINKGMVLADARALFPDLESFDEKPGLEVQLCQRLAEWCIRFTPVAAVDLLGGMVLDVTGCPHLWGSEEAYVQDITGRLGARGYRARAALADTVGLAWAVARFGKGGVVESGKGVEALRELPPESLRIDADTCERLHKLGLHRIGDILSIPLPALRRRFGPELIRRLNQALGAEEEFLEPVCPIEPYGERLPCLEPIMRIEGIEIALERLLQSLCARLQKEGKGLRAAHFRGYRIDGKTAGVQIETHRASCNREHLFHLFGMKLSTIEPGPGIELFLLEATRVEEYQPAQEGFWKQGGGIRDQRVCELVDRLSGRIGPQAIVRYLPDAHYWPERSFKKAASLDEPPTTEWKLDRPRPLQLLSTPERIEVAAPIPDYPPLHFRYAGKLHTVRKADGPERIEQEWWITEGEHRDYYAVEDEEGCRYWLFRSGHYNEQRKPEWYLHGFFV